MRLGLLAALILVAVPLKAVPPAYHVLGDEPGPWPKILESVGFLPVNGGAAGIVVLRRGSDKAGDLWRDRVEKGMFLVLEGESAVAESFGFKPTRKRVAVQSLREERAPKLSVVWESALELPVWEIPKEARVFTAERWDNAPLVAGVKIGAGAVLWVAVTPGSEGYERFPYLMQALGDLGLTAPFRSSRLWAFFDASYRLRVDVDYFARRWKRSGIAALQVAAWHNYDDDAEKAKYLERLIEACHREGILVYAWLELPHVSEEFWEKHPEWREKTALQQDAQLDWRKLMNLTNRAAFAEASAGVQNLLTRFDWDGVNLAELYFESLEGASNPARFTPLNADVRREFHARSGVDPLTLFDPSHKNDAVLKDFLVYRAELAARRQAEWMDVLGKVRRSKTHLDLVVTQIDDQFDPRMRDLLGADTSRTLPLVEKQGSTFMIEDPATVWNLGPKRYPEIAAKYQALTKRREQLAIDINIVERYQDVYPTKRQTGTELFQLVHLASRAFERVALYFESSIARDDEPWLASAASTVTEFAHNGDTVTVASRDGVGLPWRGPATVDGQPWPFQDDETLWLPAGRHIVRSGAAYTGPPRIVTLGAKLKSLNATAKAIDFAYESPTRVFWKLDGRPKEVEVDGLPFTWSEGATLPRGQHLVTIR